MENIKLKIDTLIENLTSKGIFKGITDNDIKMIRREIVGIAAHTILVIDSNQRNLIESSYNELVK